MLYKIYSNIYTFTWSTWWNVVYIWHTFDITVVEVCSLKIYRAYFMGIKIVLGNSL
jgi:hypothetical protein